jgi:hypothetical protein
MTELKLQFSRQSLIRTFFLFSMFLLFSWSCQLWGQQNFTPLKQGEYEIVEDGNFFNPGAQIGGSYKAYYSVFKDGFINEGDLASRFQQDIELRIQSRVNTNLSLHAYIGNKSKGVEQQDEPYYTEYADEATDTTADEGMDLEFREAYLEYNHNPNAQLKIGKQFINVGDGIGLIYQGRATAISQQCRIGTWCYYVGGARLGKTGDSSIYWVQIDYPVYESGNLITDRWVNMGVRQEISFNVELMRVMYRGIHIPMSKSGQWIGEGSVYQETTTIDNETKPVYFDNDGVEYMGVNLFWNYYDYLLRFSWLNLAGKRDYFAESSTSSKDLIDTQQISGNAYYLDMNYQIMKSWKTGLKLFTATGTEMDDEEKVWEGESHSYMEIQKGDYGDALIYFNGREGTGQGHSVANLKYYSIYGSYRTEGNSVLVKLGLYTFSRNAPVFYNVIGEEEKTATHIGEEFDFEIFWNVEEKLKVGAMLALFFPDNAYSANDNVRPVEDPKDISLVGINLQYDF